MWSNEFTGQELLYASLVAKEKIATIATNAKVYNYVIFCPIEGNLGRCYLHSEKNF